jgi:hypothetical protein
MSGRPDGSKLSPSTAHPVRRFEEGILRFVADMFHLAYRTVSDISDYEAQFLFVRVPRTPVSMTIYW